MLNIMPDAHHKVLYQGIKKTGNVPSNTTGLADPKSALASTSQSLYDEYQDIGGQELETDLYSAMDDTSAIDKAEEFAKKATRDEQGIQQRNLERYGVEMTPAQRSEMAKQNQRASKLSVSNALNQSRFATMINRLQRGWAAMSVGNSRLATAMEGLSTLSGLQTAQEQAYRNAKQSEKNARRGFFGSVLSKII